MQSGYHNLPSFDGVDQMNGRRYTATDVKFDTEARSISSELREAYLPEAKIKSYVREIGMSGGTVIIKENILLEERKNIDFHIMTSVEPKIIEDGKILLNKDRVLCYDTVLKAEVETFDPVGMETKSAWETEVLYRIHFTINTDICNVTFTIK